MRSQPFDKRSLGYEFKSDLSREIKFLKMFVSNECGIINLCTRCMKHDHPPSKV
jgi:hypothetical protein